MLPQLQQSVCCILHTLGKSRFSAACRTRDAFCSDKWMLLNLSCRSCRDLFVSGLAILGPVGPETNQCLCASLRRPGSPTKLLPLSRVTGCALVRADGLESSSAN